MVKDFLFFFTAFTTGVTCIALAQVYEMGPVVTGIITFILTLCVGQLVYRK